MRRPAMLAGGTALGAAAVMVLPTPAKPQQVALPANAGASAKPAASTGAATTAPTTTTTKPKRTRTPAAARTVVGSPVSDQYGSLQVKLTIKAGRISKVGFTTFVANDGHSAGIDQSAAPILIQETIAAQSAHIQGVSGATYTTDIYEQSLQSAIDKAGLKA
jgi:uncharacterized protein with FMN-binding domain